MSAAPQIKSLVLLHGMPRSGKDTVAQYAIDRYGFHHLKFATHLYREVAEAFDVSVAQLESHEWKTRPQIDLAPWLCRDPEFAEIQRATFPAGEIPTSRRILQLWGTEYRRRQDNDYWVKRLDADMHAAAQRGHERFVVSDLREQHEAQWALLQTLRGVVTGPTHMVELVRPGAVAIDTGGGVIHRTDQRLPSHYLDATVHNVGDSIRVLHSAVDCFFNPARQGAHWNW